MPKRCLGAGSTVQRGLLRDLVKTLQRLFLTLGTGPFNYTTTGRTRGGCDCDIRRKLGRVSVAGHVPGSREYRRLLIALFFAGIATFAQLYTAQAVLPQLATAFEVSPATAALTVSLSTLGIAASVIPWSMLADRIGRVPAMMIGIIAASVLGIITPFSPDFTWLLAVRLLEGVALGAIPAIALAYLSEEVDAGHAAAAAGSYIAGTTVGGLAGRVLTGPVGELWGWRAGMWTTAAVCVAAAVLFLWLVPPARRFVPGRSGTGGGASIGARLAANLRSPVQLALYAQGFLLMGAFVALYNYIGFHAVAPPFLLPASVVSLLFLAYLAGTFSSPWAGTLAARFGRLRVLLAAIAVMALGAGVLLIPHIVALLAGLIIFTGGFFGAHAVASGWAPFAAVPQARAQSSSLYYLGYYGGSSLFGWCLGLVFAELGWGALIAAIVAMAAVAAVCAVLALRGRESAPAST